MKFEIFRKLLTFNGIILFIENKNIYILKILKLLDSKKIKYEVVIKEKKNQNYQKDNKFNYISKISFFLLFFFNRKSKKILFVSQPLYAIYYIFLNKFILVANDCHYGLPKVSNLKLFLEKLVIKNVSSIIHRDLRLWKIYKNKLRNKKNLLIPDFLEFSEINKLENRKIQMSENIYAVVLGWVDQKEVQVTDTVYKLLKLGVNITFYIPEKCFEEIIDFYNNIKKNYNSQIEFKKFINHKEMISDISKYHIGICPHSKKNSQISKIYRENCSSSRIIDYINAKLTILVSKNAFFQRYIIKSYNLNPMNIFDIDTIKNKSELENILKLENNSIVLKKKIFNQDYLSLRLEKFIS